MVVNIEFSLRRWGICERHGPKQYDFGAYMELFKKARKHGLKVQAVMSFHAGGGNVGDGSCDIPLPDWVIKVRLIHLSAVSLCLTASTSARKLWASYGARIKQWDKHPGAICFMESAESENASLCCIYKGCRLSRAASYGSWKILRQCASPLEDQSACMHVKEQVHEVHDLHLASGEEVDDEIM